jgi:hypothetical protein
MKHIFAALLIVVVAGAVTAGAALTPVRKLPRSPYGGVPSPL